MTEKLYNRDAYLFSFSATVISCRKTEHGYAVILDRTAFFPEGGGQAGDPGTLNGIPVIDVQDLGDDVIHYLQSPLTEGQPAKGSIDAEERLRRMANHTGEHIFSGLVFSRFGYANTGFHLGDRDMTVDYSGEMTEEEVRLIEREANRVIRENREIRCFFPSKEELRNLSYRSKKELTGAVRIVIVDGVDVCACCAPHVRRTGEIGALVVTERIRWKGGVRLRMRCAADAEEEYTLLRRDEGELSRLLSVPRGEAAAAVKRLTEEIEDLRRQEIRLRRESALQQIERLPNTNENLCLFLERADGNLLRTVADAGREKCGKYFVCLTPEGDGFRYAVAAQGNLRSELKEINRALQGKGGGDDRLAMGYFSAKQEQIENYFHSEKMMIQ